jgi:hypothetical protein
MSKLEAKTFTTPILRLVAGSVSEAIDKDFDGRPLTVKTGANAGDETQRFSFGVAVPKVAGKHWSDNTAQFLTDVWATAHAHMGPLAQRPDFSFKVQDGDSTVPNKKNRKPCDNEGWPGHWVVFFSSSFAPSTYNADGSAPVPAESIKKGHYVQVAGSVVGNSNQTNPGVFINHSMVAHSGFGPEIKSANAPDPKAAGFGGALPVGASKAPVSGLPGTPPPPAVSAPPPAAAPPPPPTQVQAAPSFIAPPPVAAAPPPPPAAPVAVWKGPAGTTRAAYEAAGWNEAQMRTAGFIG